MGISRNVQLKYELRSSLLHHVELYYNSNVVVNLKYLLSLNFLTYNSEVIVFMNALPQVIEIQMSWWNSQLFAAFRRI